MIGAMVRSIFERVILIIAGAAILGGSFCLRLVVVSVVVLAFLDVCPFPRCVLYQRK